MAKGENIFKRKDGRWEARYKKGYDANHKIIYGYCYGHTYKEAKEKVTQHKAAALSSQLLTTKHDDETFSTFCLSWLQRNADSWKPSTFSKYEAILENHILPEFAAYHISQLNTKQLALFSSKLLHEKRLSSKTVRDILSLFHKITEDMSVWSNNAIKPITIAYPKMEFTKLRVLSSEEQTALISYLNHEMDIFKFTILLALTTGLRIGEICGLRWRDISVESNTVTVTHTVQRIKNPDKAGEKKDGFTSWYSKNTSF